MALSYNLYCNFYEYFLAVKFGNNWPADNFLRAFIKSSGFLAQIFCACTLGYVLFSAIPNIINKLFKQFIKVYLKNQVQLLVLALVFSKPSK